MKTIDYINSLIKEKEELTTLCKSHVETILTLKKEVKKLNTIILTKDKKIKKLESNSNSIEKDELESIKKQLNQFKLKYDKLKNEYDDVILTTPVEKHQKDTGELNKLKSEYKKLQRKCESIILENEEYKRIFDEMEKTCDSD